MTEEKARELGISRRTYFDWKRKLREGKQIILKNQLKIILFSEIL
jgi:transposase-like protein